MARNKRNFRGLKAHGRSALRQHLLSIAEQARATHGELSAPGALGRLLSDRAIVRYPTAVTFSDEGIAHGTFARTCSVEEPEGRRFTIQVQTRFSGHPDLPTLVAYHLPSVNYGQMPTADDCLAFGAALTHVDEDTYYNKLCALVDQTPG